MDAELQFTTADPQEPAAPQFVTQHHAPDQSAAIATAAVSGIESLKARLKQHADLAQRLRELEGQVDSVRRQSAAPAVVDSRVVDAIKKANARLDSLEKLTTGLLEALSAMSDQYKGLERVVHALSQCGDGL